MSLNLNSLTKEEMKKILSGTRNQTLLIGLGALVLLFGIFQLNGTVDNIQMAIFKKVAKKEGLVLAGKNYGTGLVIMGSGILVLIISQFPSLSVAFSTWAKNRKR